MIYDSYSLRRIFQVLDQGSRLAGRRRVVDASQVPRLARMRRRIYREVEPRSYRHAEAGRLGLEACLPVSLQGARSDADSSIHGQGLRDQKS